MYVGDNESMKKIKGKGEQNWQQKGKKKYIGVLFSIKIPETIEDGLRLFFSGCTAAIHILRINKRAAAGKTSASGPAGPDRQPARTQLRGERNRRAKKGWEKGPEP